MAREIGNLSGLRNDGQVIFLNPTDWAEIEVHDEYRGPEKVLWGRPVVLHDELDRGHAYIGIAVTDQTT